MTLNFEAEVSVPFDFDAESLAGEVTNDMVLGNIFEHFCIGK